MFGQDSHWQLLKPEQTVTVQFCSEKNVLFKEHIETEKTS